MSDNTCHGVRSTRPHPHRFSEEITQAVKELQYALHARGHADAPEQLDATRLLTRQRVERARLALDLVLLLEDP